MRLVGLWVSKALPRLSCASATWTLRSKLAQKMHRQDASGIIGLAGSIAASPGCNSEVDEDRLCHLEEDQIGLAGSIAASPGCNSEVDEDRLCHLEEDQNIRKRSLG